MTTFKEAMTGLVETKNGALSLSTPDTTGKYEGLLSLFFKSVRGLNIPMLYEYLLKANNENVIDTFLLCFHIRDCREGKGERELGRKSLLWLFLNNPHQFRKIYKFIPEYGRWDDLLMFFPLVLNLENLDFVEKNYSSSIKTEKNLNFLRQIQKEIVNFYANSLKKDKKNMLEGKPISLASKWAPTEGDSLDKKYKVFNTLAKALKTSPKFLRKNYLSPMRTYINIVEKKMCENSWDDINYNTVPSCAMKKLKKAFKEHDTFRFEDWQSSLLEKNNTKTKTKVCGEQLFPYELIDELRINNKCDNVCQAQWNVLEKKFKENSTFKDDIAVVDTSYSMYSPKNIPINVAISLGLMISRCSEGEFKNTALTFNTNPELVMIPDTDDLYTRYKSMKEMSWGGTTDLYKTFYLILERAKKFNLSPDKMPKRLWIISDMQFNQIHCNHTNETNFEAIDRLYKNSNYKRPQIVFWNVNGDSTDFPVSGKEDGTCLISGFSTSVMKSVFSNCDFNPYSIFRNTLDSERLSSVKKELEKN